jgi:hypothetical protein
MVNFSIPIAASDDFSPQLKQEMIKNEFNGCVGTKLVSETESLRIWHLVLKPNERMPFHRHVNPYFWTVHSNGFARNYDSSGNVTDVEYNIGDTQHYEFDGPDYMLHSIQNIGETTLIFTTVEFLTNNGYQLAISD